MRIMRWCVVATVVLLAAALALPVGAGEVGKRPSVVRPSKILQPSAFAVTPPLRDLPVAQPGPSGPPREIPNRPVDPARLPALTFPDAKAPAGGPQGEGRVAGSTGTLAPAPLVSFNSLNSDTNQAVLGFRVMPPDTEGAVGPNHYIQWINLVWAVYDKSGTLLGGPWPGNSLWQALPPGSACRTSNDGDPVVLYDHGADRWLMSQFALPSSNYTCLAVSQTGDPLGSWYVWEYLYSPTIMNDYPKFGVWPDGYYMTVNEFPGANPATVVFDRIAMLAGSPTVGAQYFPIAVAQPAFPQPTHWDGGAPPPPGSPNYNVAFYDDAWGNPFDLLQICTFTVDWATPANSAFTCPAGFSDPGIINLTAAGLSFDSNLCGYSRNCIPQQGTTQKLDALSDRLMFPLNYRNLMSTLGYEVMVVTHSVDVGGDHAGVRWYELRNTGSGWYVHDGGTFAPDAHHRWMGSAAVDQNGNIGLVYSISSSTMYPSVGYTGRLASDPPGTMQTEGIAVAGGGYQTGGNRWGDYASIHTDPDGCTLWGTAEYVANTGSFDWDTWVVAFAMPGCTPTGFGTLNGTVVNASSLAPIGGAQVQAGAYVAITQPNGSYAMNLPSGTYDVTASAFGYSPETVNGIVITDGNTTTQDFALTPAASAELDGFVVGQAHGWPLYAKVDIKVGPTVVASTFTNPFNGYYFFAGLPAPDNYDMVVTSQIPGYNQGMRSITLSAMGQTENFALVDDGAAEWVICKLSGGINEGFEGAWPPAGWTVTHDSGKPNCLWTNVSGRSNLTGGTGKFAIADSDLCGSGSTMGTTLTSPIIDLTGVPNVGIQFKYDYYHLGSQRGYVDISNDGGATWTTIKTFSVSERGPRTYEADLTAQWANQANARIRFRFVSPGWNWWWMIDEVRTIIPAVPPPPPTVQWVENFNAPTPPALPAGWAKVQTGGTNVNTDWKTATATVHPAGQPPHSPPNLAYFNSWSVGTGNAMRLYKTSTDAIPPGGAGFVGLWMYHDTGFSGSADRIQVQYSPNGTTWTNAGATINRYDGSVGWKYHQVELTGATGNVYIGLNAISAYGNDIHIDDVEFLTGLPGTPALPLDPTGFACNPVPGTLVEGFVTDGNTAAPIVGAKVEHDLGGETRTIATPADPNLADGFYVLFTPVPGGYGPATRTFTASHTGYGNDVKMATPTPNTVYQINFSLPTGWLTVSPTSLYARLYRTEEDHQDLNLSNQGGLAVNYQLITTALTPSWPHLSPVVQGNRPSGGDAPSAGPAPRVPRNVPAAPRSVPEVSNVPAYGVDVYPGSNFVHWPNISAPGTWSVVSPRPEYFFAGDFRQGDFSKLWVLNYSTNELATINTASGAVTVVGPAPPVSGQSWTGLTAAVDGTLYASSTQCGTSSTLYTVNPASGATTVIGPITNGACIIDIAITPGGDLYGVDLVSDSLIKINTATGAGTVVGPLGIDANYAQGMDYDEMAGQLLWAAYNNTTSQGELRVIDTTTGASTLVGPFPGGAEVGAFGVAFYIGGGLPWLVLTPDQGVVNPISVLSVVNPISVLSVDAHFIADGANRWGTYRAKIMTMHDSATPVPDVNVCFIKAFDDVPPGYWADKFVHAVAGAKITHGAAGTFNPEGPMTRSNMARWLLLGRFGNTYAPPPCQGIFADVDCDTTPNADWIEALYNEGITAGCGTNPLRFCPDQIVTRRQMAIFLLKAKEPPGYTPPACTGTMFGDVTCAKYSDAWIEELARRGITTGCGGGNYCPEMTTTRAQQSVFVTRTWNLPRCP